MKQKLLLEAIIKYISGLILVGLLLFLPAWSFNYFNGWLFMGLLFIPMFIVGIVLLIVNPNLLRRRLNNKEKESEQKSVIALSGIMFLLGFILAGLNYRFNWYHLPKIWIIIGCIIFIISYILYGLVLKQNEYLLRTIEVEDNQQLVDTGFYKIVRHPMYSITVFLFLSMPLVLDSIFSLIIFLIYPFIIIKRINNEEKVLEKDLKGYKEYQKKTKYKLIPYIY